MKKVFLIGSIIASGFVFTACNDQKKENTHMHDDGSTHADHDTTKPHQEEFTVGDSTKKDSVKEHTHENGEKHSH